MIEKTLRRLYAAHAGKVSDKWSIYLDEYDRILSPYRKRPIRLLEIGVQNGGSLEIWGEYFSRARKLVGCDIDPKCASLAFENPRISVVTGDATSDETLAAIIKHSAFFDVIMDDGSHRSSDIVKSFAKYFPNLSDGGVFIAEDLHCSYWKDYEGGLFDPYSSITFFKRLADIIGYEHWGVEKSRSDILAGIFSKYQVHMEEEILQHVHSVEFINSMCIVRKAKPDANNLGTRMIAGVVENIKTGHLGLNGLRASPAPTLDQADNVWTARSMPPDEELLFRIRELSDRETQIGKLTESITDREAEIARLNASVMDRESQIVSLNACVLDREGQIARLNDSITEHDELILSLSTSVVDRESQIAKLNQSVLNSEEQISKLNQSIIDRNGLIARLNEAVVKREGQLASLNATMLEREGQIARLYESLNDRETQIEKLNEAVRHREGQISKLNQAVIQRERQVGSLNKSVLDRDLQISGLNEAVTDRDKEIAGFRVAMPDRDGRILRLGLAITERDRQIANMSQRISERDREVASLSRKAADAEQTVSVFKNSITWRLTKPARIIGAPFANLVRRFLDFLDWIPGFLEGETKASRHLNLGSLRFYVDPSNIGLIKFVKGSSIVSGWAADLETHSAAKVRIVVGKSVYSPRAMPRADVKLALSPVCSLPLETGFARVISLPIGVHWMRIEVQAADGTWISVRQNLLFCRPAMFFPEAVVDDHLRFNIDKPEPGKFKIVKNSTVFSGWAADLAAHSAAKIRIVVGKSMFYTYPKQREDVQKTFSPIGPLPLDTGFASVVLLRVGLYRMRIEVQGDEGEWIPIRRALLFRAPMLRKKRRTDGISYAALVRFQQKRLKSEIPEINRHIDLMIDKPVFTIIIDTRQGSAGLATTIQSIQNQLYSKYDIRILGGGGGRGASSIRGEVEALEDLSLSDVRGEFVVLIKSGERLAVSALYEFASAINQYPDIDLVYGDEDVTDPLLKGTKCIPFYKPGWSPDYLETFNYIGSCACFRTAIARGSFELSHQYDFVLRFTERTKKVVHIAKVLGHTIATHQEGNKVSSRDIEALSGRLSRTNRSGSVREHALHKGCYDIQLNLKRTPLVSVVIPTAGKTVQVGDSQIDLLSNVVAQILDKSTYKNLEIVIIDNGDLSTFQLEMLTRTGCRRITYTDPVFNIAKKLNLGASIANGELLLILNDDIEILTPSWIERLVEHFEKPHVGVVGAKLLYPDERTQHVGVVHNSGNPDHVRRLFPRNDSGYFFSTCGVRNFSAVTGACMLTPAWIYREVGGYSTELAISYNDADYCLKVRQKGFWVVYAPEAELIHMESQSRVASADQGEVAWYHRRWAPNIISDEFYNERFLTVASPTFVPCVNQRML